MDKCLSVSVFLALIGRQPLSEDKLYLKATIIVKPLLKENDLHWKINADDAFPILYMTWAILVQTNSIISVISAKLVYNFPSYK